MAITVDRLTINDLYDLLHRIGDEAMGPFENEQERIHAAIEWAVEMEAKETTGQAVTNAIDTIRPSVERIIEAIAESENVGPAVDAIYNSIMSVVRSLEDEQLALRQASIRLAYRTGFEMGHRQGIVDHATLLLTGGKAIR